MNAGNASDADTPDPSAGFWRIADPKITLASVAGLALGSMMAADAGPIDWPWLFLTVVGIFAFEAAKNASGEIFDFDSGADQAVDEKDRSPFSGGKRVLVDGLLTRTQTAQVAAWFYAAGILAGLMIFVLKEPSVLWLGLAGAALAYFYHAPPFRLSYRGLGELAVAVAYGPIITTGAYLVQRGEIPTDVLLASMPLGLLVAAFLWINEFPDAEADGAAGKRTMVVRLGKPIAARTFVAIVLGAFALAAVLPLLGVGRGVWVGLIGLPQGLRACRRLVDAPDDTPRIIPAQAWTLGTFLLYAIGAGVGILVI